MRGPDMRDRNFRDGHMRADMRQEGRGMHGGDRRRPMRGSGGQGNNNYRGNDSDHRGGDFRNNEYDGPPRGGPGGPHGGGMGGGGGPNNGGPGFNDRQDVSQRPKEQQQQPPAAAPKPAAPPEEPWVLVRLQPGNRLGEVPAGIKVDNLLVDYLTRRREDSRAKQLSAEESELLRPGRKLIAAAINGIDASAATLTSEALQDSTVSPIFRDSELGQDIINRSVTLVAAAAASIEFPNMRFRVVHALKRSMLVELVGPNNEPMAVSEEVAERLERQMRDLVRRDVTIRQNQRPPKKVIKNLTHAKMGAAAEAPNLDSMSAAARLVLSLNEPTVCCAECVAGPGGQSSGRSPPFSFLATFMGTLVCSTGMLDAEKDVKLSAVTRTTLSLHLGPATKVPSSSIENEGNSTTQRGWQPIKDDAETGEWTNTVERTPTVVLVALEKAQEAIGVHQVDCVAAVNALARGSPAELRRVVGLMEGIQEAQLQRLANDVFSKNTQVLRVAGGIGSGSTLVARRLAAMLSARGMPTRVLSLSSFTRSVQQSTPGTSVLNVSGVVDWAAVDTQVKNLVGSEFGAQSSSMVSCLIVEGVGALEPATSDPPSGLQLTRLTTHSLYVDPLPPVRINELRFVKAEELRVLRLVAAEAKAGTLKLGSTTGNSVSDLLSAWPKADAAEESRIRSHVEAHCDSVFSSSLPHEIAVLRPFVEGPLRSISPEHPTYGTARRLIDLVRLFDPMPVDVLPDSALVREFVGGSWYFKRG